jgi:hypothetical protein
MEDEKLKETIYKYAQQHFANTVNNQTGFSGLGSAWSVGGATSGIISGSSSVGTTSGSSSVATQNWTFPTYFSPVVVTNCFKCKKPFSDNCKCLEEEIKKVQALAMQYIICGVKIHKVWISKKGKIILSNHHPDEQRALKLAQLPRLNLPDCYLFLDAIDSVIKNKYLTAYGFNNSFMDYFNARGCLSPNPFSPYSSIPYVTSIPSVTINPALLPNTITTTTYPTVTSPTYYYTTSTASNITTQPLINNNPNYISSVTTTTSK